MEINAELPTSPEVDHTAVIRTAIETDPGLRDRMTTAEGEPNDTCKQLLRYMLSTDGRLVVSHLSSVNTLWVKMTDRGRGLAVQAMVIDRVLGDREGAVYEPAVLTPHAFFAAHDLLWLGLVEEIEPSDG